MEWKGIAKFDIWNRCRNLPSTALLKGAFLLLLCTVIILQVTFNCPKQIRSSTRSRNDFKRLSKWIIVTSIFSPTVQIKKLAQIPGWQLLVVGDTKTPKNWNHSNVIFLDMEAQRQLGYNILKYIPENAYTRKNIGYLYAIQHGAKYIYDTDDDNAPNDPLQFEKYFAFSSKSGGVISGNSKMEAVMNPYVHFGQPSIWPRGFPLERVNQPYNDTYTTCDNMRTPYIQQGLVNGDPDVDAIFRLTRKKTSAPLNIQFDKSAPPVILPKNILSPFNSQNTLFHYEAFWSLVLPVSVSFRVTDIWRGYWAQPLLWSAGGNVGFYGPQTTQIRNNHSYLQDFGEEILMYKESGKLTKYLKEWKCQNEVSLFACMVELTSEMVHLDMWSSVEVDLINAWILDLKAIGYLEPNFANKDPCPKSSSISLVKFNSVEMEIATDKKFRMPLRSFCKSFNFTHTQSVTHFPSILLIVTFKFPHYKNIWLLDSIYRPHYPNILYCGDLNLQDFNSILTSKRFVEANIQKLSIVNVNASRGDFVYDCALKAIEMNYNVDGYLFVSNDILFNFWNIWKYKPTNNAMIQGYKVGRDGYLNTELPPNTNWPKWSQRKATKIALQTLYDNANASINIDKFIRNRKNSGFNSSLTSCGPSDLFYFPDSMKDIFYDIGKVVREHDVMLEIAVPLIFSGISETPGNIVRLPGKDLWTTNRTEALTKFNADSAFNDAENDVYLHPIEYSEMFLNETFKSEFCESYISHVLANTP